MKLLLLQLKNIFRYKSRYIVLGVLLIIVAVVCLASFKAYDTAELAIDKIGMDLGAEVTIRKGDGKALNKADLQMALDTGYIEKVDIIKYTEYVHYPIIDILTDDDDCVNQGETIFYVIGFNRPEDIAKIPLIAGALPQNDDECVMTDGDYIFYDETAEPGERKFKRRFSVGDVISFTNFCGDKSTRTLKVVGLASNPNPELISPDGTIFNSCMYTTFKQAESFWYTGAAGSLFPDSQNMSFKYGDELYWSGYDAVFTLHTYSDFENFLGAIMSKGEYIPPGASFSVSKYSAMYLNISIFEYVGLTASFRNLKAMSLLMLLIAAIISVVIVAVMTFMILNERKYDMGVLRCVGMGKGRIMLNISAELLVFFLGVIAVSLAAGYWLSDSVMGLIGTVPESAAGADGLSLFLGVAWKMLLAGLGFAALSSGLSMAYILRYQPMKILINRN